MTSIFFAGKAFHKDNDLVGKSNRFFEISAVKSRMVASNLIVTTERISLKVVENMFCTDEWLKKYYFDPLNGRERNHFLEYDSTVTLMACFMFKPIKTLPCMNNDIYTFEDVQHIVLLT